MSDFSSEDERWMDYALQLADRAEQLGEVPVGAVIVLDGEVIGEGWNRPISGHDPTAHAEIMALRAAAEKLANYRLLGAQLYVTIEPCTMCTGAMVHARIQRLVYGATEEKAGVIDSNGQLLEQPWFNHQIKYEKGILAERCSQKISAFFQRRREEKKAVKKNTSEGR